MVNMVAFMVHENSFLQNKQKLSLKSHKPQTDSTANTEYTRHTLGGNPQTAL